MQSEERARFETYSLRAGEALVPLPAVFCCPEPLADIGSALGWEMPGRDQAQMPEGDADFAVRAIIACRFCPGGADDAQAATDPYCCVGGILQLTTLERDAIISRVVHRWPDVIGQRMDPHHGAIDKQVPAWLLEPAGD